MTYGVPETEDVKKHGAHSDDNAKNGRHFRGVDLVASIRTSRDRDVTV